MSAQGIDRMALRTTSSSSFPELTRTHLLRGPAVGSTPDHRDDDTDRHYDHRHEGDNEDEVIFLRLGHVEGSDCRRQGNDEQRGLNEPPPDTGHYLQPCPLH